MIVSSRTLALGLASSLVVVIGVYLFVEVRAEPAAPPSAADKLHAQPSNEPPAQSPPEVPRPHGRAPAPPPPQQAPQQPSPGDHAPTLGAGERTIAQAPDQMMRANPRLDDLMLEASKSYDSGDYDRAREIAQQVLAKQPSNVRMLRVMVSSACIEGDQAVAQTYYNQLPPNDRAQMRTRCADKSGMTFTEPTAP